MDHRHPPSQPTQVSQSFWNFNSLSMSMVPMDPMNHWKTAFSTLVLVSLFCASAGFSAWLGSQWAIALADTTSASKTSTPWVKRPITEYLKTTRDREILQAYELLPGSPGEASMAKILKSPVRVFFKDLSVFGKQVRNFDALSWISETGQHVIFINEKHRNAPSEALAALIAHEALHDDMENSYQEEVAGWTLEAQVWHMLKSRNPSLNQYVKGQNPLVDRLNTLETALQQGQLDQLVRTNPGYKGLPEESFGYKANNVSSHGPLSLEPRPSIRNHNTHSPLQWAAD